MIRPNGQEVPARCDRIRCPACIVPVALDTARALAMARPSLALTLTGLPRQWSAVREHMDRFRRTLRRRGIGGHLAYHVEPNSEATPLSPSGPTAHCHAWWRGPDITKSLSEYATTAGMGYVVDARRASWDREDGSIPALRYGLKMILETNPAAPEELWPAAETFLELNGGDLVHATHGFWEDWQGNRLALREARTIARNRGRRPRGARYVPTV